jgi:hypothetical protein
MQPWIQQLESIALLEIDPKLHLSTNSSELWHITKYKFFTWNIQYSLLSGGCSTS